MVTWTGLGLEWTWVSGYGKWEEGLAKGSRTEQV